MCVFIFWHFSLVESLKLVVIVPFGTFSYATVDRIVVFIVWIFSNKITVLKSYRFFIVISQYLILETFLQYNSIKYLFKLTEIG